MPILPRNLLLNQCCSILLPFVLYTLPIWGSFTNKDGLLALESLHCRAAKLMCGLTQDMLSVEVLFNQMAKSYLAKVKWDFLHLMSKVKLATLAYTINYDCTTPVMGHILTKKTFPMHHLRTKNTVIVPNPHPEGAKD